MFKTMLFLIVAAALPLTAAAQSPGESPRTVGVRAQADSPAARQLAPRTPHQRAIADLQEQGRQKVRSLMAAMKDLPDGPALLAMQRKVEEVKRDTRLGLLRLHLERARTAGDGPLAAEAQRQIDLILAPPAPAVSAVSRPARGAAEGSR